MKKNVLIVALVLLVALVGCAEHEHAWKEVGSTAPTCTSEGERLFKCEGCGATRTEKLDKLPHELSDDGWTFNGEKFKYEQKCKSCNEIQYKEIESGVRIQGIAGFEDRLFATANEAYDEISPVLKASCGLGEEPLSDDSFDALFTNVDENGDAKVVWTIYGEQKMLDDDKHPSFVSFGRKASHYSIRRHFSKVDIVGGNENAKVVCSTLRFWYEWWGEDHLSYVSFKGLAVESNESTDNLMPQQSNNGNDGIAVSFENCKIKGSFHCFNNSTNILAFENCEFDSLEDKKYSIHAQGNNEKPTTVRIEGCTFKNSRGVNIDQTTAEAKIVGNTFVNCGNLSDNEDNNYYGVIQVTQGANVLVEGNTIENCKGNAIWVWSSKGTGAFKGKLTVKDNVINNCSYAFADYGNTYTLESSGNKISGTNVDKCFARVVEGESVVYKEIDATTKLK